MKNKRTKKSVREFISNYNSYNWFFKRTYKATKFKNKENDLKFRGFVDTLIDRMWYGDWDEFFDSHNRIIPSEVRIEWNILLEDYANAE